MANNNNPAIPVKFNRGCTVHVPAECLIEDYQSLQQAIRDRDWDSVETVASCIACAIEDYMEVPAELGLKFTPSASSAILMECESGILSKPDGSDIACANGGKLSVAHNAPCWGPCPFQKDGRCNPEAGLIRLENGSLYVSGEVGEDSKTQCFKLE